MIFNILTFSQNVNFSDSITWTNKIHTIQAYNEKDVEFILFSEKLAYNPDNYLPLYKFRDKISLNSKIEKIDLINVKYEIIADSLLKNVKNLNLITTNPEINSWISTSRKIDYLNFEFIPLRKNVNGKIERLIYFECNIYLSEDRQKSSKAGRTYVNSSKLADGKWYKIKVDNSNVYKLTYSQLKSMGFLDSDMNSIGVFGYGKMVSKLINDSYIDDLQENPIYRADVNNNGIFDEGDYFLFYADGPNEIKYNSTGNFSHTMHEYSDFSYYFISNQGTWKQATTSNSLTTSNINVTTYDEYKFLEKDSLNLLESGRRFFWKIFDSKLSYNFSLHDENVSTTDSVKVKVCMVGRSSSSSNFAVKFNGITSPPTEMSILNLGGSTYAIERISSKNFKTTSNDFAVTITYNKYSSSALAWLDYISFSYRKNLSLNSGQICFRDTKSVGTGNISKFIIESAPVNTIVWDITDRKNISKINGNYENNKYNIIRSSDALHEYLAFNPNSSFSAPIFSGSAELGFIKNQNLHALNPVDLIIVTNPVFSTQALGYKALHEQHDNMSVLIVTPQEIYNEFSSGTPDISAIRNFIKMLYDRSTSIEELPKNVMLLGDGSYENKSTAENISNFIFTYQTWESLTTLGSSVSDDFFVFLDDGEGNNLANEDIDIGIGRIPVKSAEEAENYLNKLRVYYSQVSYGNWKNNVLLLADDADLPSEVSFQKTMKSISINLRLNHTNINVEHIFLDSYPQIYTINGQRYPDANQAFVDAMNNGVFILSWLGHGNYKAWASEQLLDLNTILNWKNTNKYPIFFTATCDFSPYDNHNVVSAGEHVLLNPINGGIALFTTTRTVFGSNGEKFTKLFMEHIFHKDANNNHFSLGQAMLNSKNDNTQTTSNKLDFTVLGDPAIIPPFPKYNVKTTKINTIDVADFQDTVKAKTRVTINGIVEDQTGVLAANFNGIIQPIIYDKFMTYSTRGNDGNPPEIFQSQHNILFKGQATVTNGEFSFSFIVPVDIAYFYDYGKISYYATENSNIDAAGYYNQFIIGGTSNEGNSDIKGPEIDLFLNNKKFVDGGISNEKPILLAKLSDESGINTVGNGIGHDLILIIDDQTEKAIVLNKFYESKIDDFTTGNINYQMPELSLGQHTIKIKAWDVFNNSSEKKLDFTVINSAELSIDHIFNYPNPFSTSTFFYISHNQPFVELTTLIQIFTISGKLIKTLKYTGTSDGFQIPPIHWDGLDEYGDNIGKGVYLYKVTVKNNTGDKIEKFEKLYIIN